MQQIGLEPDALLPADVDETPARGESPRELVKRLARAKAEVARRTARNREDMRDAFIVVGRHGRRRRPAARPAEGRGGRRGGGVPAAPVGPPHRVYTALCMVTPKDAVRERIVETRIRFKRLSREEVETYLASGEWRGKAGGYAIQGLAGAFVVKLVGSYTNVVGLPLYETMLLLDGEGYPVRLGWLNAA